MVAFAIALLRRGQPGWRDQFHQTTGHWPGCPHVHQGRDLPPCECREQDR